MKRFYCIAVLLLCPLMLACGGVVGTITVSPPAPTLGGGPAPLKENERKGFLEGMGGTPSEVTLIEDDGAEKKYACPDRPKFIVNGNPDTSVGLLMKKDVIITLEKKDGKEVVTEIRSAPAPKGPSTNGEQVVGKFVKVNYPKETPNGILFLEVDGKERQLKLAKACRIFDPDGRPTSAEINFNFAKQNVIAVVQKKDGAEYVTEIWCKK